MDEGKRAMWIKMYLLLLATLCFRVFSAIHDGISDRGFCYQCDMRVVGWWAWHVIAWLQRDVWQLAIYLWQIFYIYKWICIEKFYLEDDVLLPANLFVGIKVMQRNFFEKILGKFYFKTSFVILSLLYIIFVAFSNYYLHQVSYNWAVLHRNLFNW